ncbi:MAG: type III pantothenate kinase [Candidatus Omnitrophica bacterium]|nr:type III pantothenate kinase [Candidatus Omnitrophota bacterium]MDD5352536.1 type III pantothenate kinase [Candidatus Omnitrophota bacterium]MDD5550134.1 type III pantothenate kinase [Candidatus Omnitrophota bacterium]
MSQLLAIDIGNTTIAFGLFKGKRLVLNFKLPTHNKSREFYKKSILRALGKKKIDASTSLSINPERRSAFKSAGVEWVDKIIICSVVPEKTNVLKNLLAGIFKKKVSVVGKNVKVPIINKYKNPKQVGQDRLVNAYAGLKLFGKGLILVDFGTAVTFDVVSKNKEYLGGLIFPGLDLSLDALYYKTALLPRIKIRKPKNLIGKDTISSMNNGIVFGMAGVCDEVIERLLRKFKGYKVIATGGNVNFIKQYSRRVKIVRPNLTLLGLRMLG